MSAGDDGAPMLSRVIKVVVGLRLGVVGAAFGALPVLPGWPLVFLGVGLVLAQSELGRHALRRIRLWARSRFGSERVREVERRLPREVLGDHDTQQMRLDVVEWERRRREQRTQGRRRERRGEERRERRGEERRE